MCRAYQPDDEYQRVSYETFSLESAREKMFEVLAVGGKAEMALEPLYQHEPRKLKPPKYIAEGLEWLQASIKERADREMHSDSTEVNDA